MPQLTIRDLMDVQASDETITPTDLVELLRDHGHSLSRRTLSFWQSQGLIPPALRVGARGGVYPTSVVDLAVFVSDMRDRGVSVEAIRELLPIWRHVVTSEHDGCIQLQLLEDLARSLDLSSEATYLVPAVVEYLTTGLCDECQRLLEWETKTGERTALSEGIQIRFAVAQISPVDGLGEFVAWTQLSLPGIDACPDADDPNLIVLGIPRGVSLRNRSCEHDVAPRTRVRRKTCRPRTPAGQEVLQLAT